MSWSHDVHISDVISALSSVRVCKASLQVDINLYKGTLVDAFVMHWHQPCLIILAIVLFCFVERDNATD